ncbi:MAG: NADH-quinone oxidoreductase subunit NuoE [Pontiellaceae bacterium]|jgi:NADH:ubiquinone oxidoreductase subunit F (NADH-binding)/NADH:ubiquinone oxidoreductase subunit E|nr:NADH-quinone oxidoreductase subunit NuoE [Pontiellaceae bacterium]
MSEKINISEVDRIVGETGRDAAAVIPILQAVQKEFKYLPEDALRRICEISEITPAQIEGVASFFSQFRRTPVGKHMISVCDGTACHVKGAEAVYSAVKSQLKIRDDDTDPDGLFTVQKVACLGCCTLAPAVQIDGVTYGHVRTDTVSNMIIDFLENEASRTPRHFQPSENGGTQGEVRIGLGSCCVAGGSAKIRDALQDSLAELQCNVTIKSVGCVGMCHRTPLLEVIIPGDEPVLYAKVKPEDIPEIIERHFKAEHPFIKVRVAVETWLKKLYSDEARNIPERYEIDVREKPVADFLGRQQHIATEHGGLLNPADMDEYKRLGGFTALAEVLAKNDPEGIIAEVEKSGLRGRGGGGFSTGRKWAMVRKAPGQKKYIILNGDEGDPGAFMDRMIMESYSYRVIEGVIIASLAVGATEGVLYIRAEYPLAVKRMRQAIADCEKAGLLGDNISGSGHSLRLKIFEGAGAFVCGEESALIASLEGRRGMPSARPPFPAEQGLHGCPTLVNNAETYSLVPWIIRNGAEAFANLGTEHSKGTKVFSLAGKIERGGLIEVPMGITINEIVNRIGGGVANGRTFKAVQIGGPSGGCIPAALGETTVDFEALKDVGAMMGSGGLVVLDDRDCMVEIAHYFLSFTQSESCGKCTPCRVGTKRMLEILTRLCSGGGRAGDIEKLEELAEIVRSQSLCGLGKTAPNPVLTTIRYFRDEFEAHIAGKCPAGKCKKLITYSISDKCIGCTKCAVECPVEAIHGEPYSVFEIDSEKCIRCGGCRQICPVDAVEVH